MHFLLAFCLHVVLWLCAGSGTSTECTDDTAKPIVVSRHLAWDKPPDSGNVFVCLFMFICQRYSSSIARNMVSATRGVTYLNMLKSDCILADLASSVQL